MPTDIRDLYWNHFKPISIKQQPFVEEVKAEPLKMIAPRNNKSMYRLDNPYDCGNMALEENDAEKLSERETFVLHDTVTESDNISMLSCSKSQIISNPSSVPLKLACAKMSMSSCSKHTTKVDSCRGKIKYLSKTANNS